MKSESETNLRFDEFAGPAVGGEHVLESEYLQRSQYRHAIATTVLPFVGTVAAIVLAFQWGIGWWEIGSLVVMYVIAMIGIEVGFHRYFTHKSFDASTPVRIALLIFGSICAQGPVTNWASNHRRHHQHTDKEGDPHSPYNHGDGLKAKLWGVWHSYVGWTYTHWTSRTTHYVKDILNDPLILKCNRYYLLWVALGVVVPTVAVGLMTLSWKGALIGFLWAEWFGCFWPIKLRFLSPRFVTFLERDPLPRRRRAGTMCCLFSPHLVRHGTIIITPFPVQRSWPFIGGRLISVAL